MKFSGSLLVISLFLGLKLEAQQKEIQPLGLKISGYVDAYWQTKFTGANDQKVFNRSFYTESATFALGNVNILLEKAFDKAGMLAQLGFGPRADVANGVFGKSGTPIQQLYIWYKPSEKIILTLGNFSTFIGYEVIDAPSNFHYSASLLFQNGPFHHTGIKANFDLGKGFSLMGGLFNKTDSKVDKDATTVSYGSQLSYSQDDFNTYLGFVSGRVSERSEKSHRRSQFDLVTEYTLAVWKLAVNASYQHNTFENAPNAGWWGMAGYVQRKLNETVSLGMRIEYFNDTDGYAEIVRKGQKSSIWDFTLSAPVTYKGLRIIPELRLDLASQATYPRSGDQLKNSQWTGGIAAMYSF